MITPVSSSSTRLNFHMADRPSTPSTPGGKPFLVALTGYGRTDDRRKALDAGFDAHLVKPVDPDELECLLAAAPA